MDGRNKQAYEEQMDELKSRERRYYGRFLEGIMKKVNTRWEVNLHQ